MNRIVVGTTGGPEAPHFKYRLGPLAERGSWPVQVIATATIPGRDEVDAILDAGGPGAVLALQRVLPSPEAMRRFKERYDAIVLDFDDAIYMAMPDVRSSSLRRAAKGALRLAVRGSTRASSRRRPLVKALRHVDVCVVGNENLTSFARRHARRVVVIPSTVDPVESAPAHRPDVPVCVWTGVAGNRQYLELIRRPLERLADEREFTLRLVCSKSWDDAPVPVEFVPWSQEAERSALLSATVGLAPVSDDPFSRGKCQYRSLLFGGHGLPAIASPVGVMDRIIVDGETGFLARSDDEWLSALRSCISDPALVARLGAQALERIRSSYSHDVGLGLWTQLFRELA